MATWKSVPCRAAMNVTPLITHKSAAIPGRATNLIQRRRFTPGRDNQGPPKAEFLALGKEDLKIISISTCLSVLFRWARHTYREMKEEKKEKNVEGTH